MRATMFVSGILTGIAGTLAAILTFVVPACPTEDSCTIDYKQGTWHIAGVKVSK